MSRNLGSVIPDSVAEAISVTETKRRNAVIILMTEDPEGYPHVALLSPYQVASNGRSDITFCVYASTETSKNIFSTGKVTLVVQKPPGIFYLKCRVDLENTAEIDVGGAPQIFFRSNTVRVLEDSSQRAPIISEIMFGQENVETDYRSTFRALADFTLQRE